jgi:hypothetical protein
VGKEMKMKGKEFVLFQFEIISTKLNSSVASFQKLRKQLAKASK